MPGMCFEPKSWAGAVSQLSSAQQHGVVSPSCPPDLVLRPANCSVSD